VQLTLLGRDHLEAAIRLLPAGLQLTPELRQGLPDLWRQLLDRGQLHGAAVEDNTQPPAQRMVALGMAAFLSPAFAARYLARPTPYPAATVYEAERRGQRVLLTDAELAAPSAEGTLTLLILHYGQSVWLDDPRGLAILSMGHAAFRLANEGYGIGCVLQEAYGPQRDFLRAGGFLLKSDYGLTADDAGEGRPDRPYLMGLDGRDPESRLPGTTASFLFQHRAPRFALSPAEQRLLLRALIVDSDAHLAEQLDLSLNTLKSTWRSIYDRVERVDTGLLGAETEATGDDGATRGREKRRRLIEYLRLHMEELRPWPRTRVGRQG